MKSFAGVLKRGPLLLDSCANHSFVVSECGTGVFECITITPNSFQHEDLIPTKPQTGPFERLAVAPNSSAGNVLIVL